VQCHQHFVLDRHGPPIQAQAGQADGQSETENKVLHGFAVLFMKRKQISKIKVLCFLHC
jgi:hypothetical protein